MSNIRKGNDFRDKIRDLCIAAGYMPLTERYVAGKKSDVVFSVFSQPRSKNIAVEAKSYKGKLAKSIVSQIIADYSPSLRDRLIDEVWVVAENDFSAEARHGLEINPGFFPLSYNEFLGTLINFPRYLQYLRLEIQQDGITNYYVPQRFVGKGSSIEYVNSWLEQKDKLPIAVLSTYGMGKTSLAKVLADNFVTQSLANPLCRIPILIRLGQLTSQQQIEGLLGTMFTSTVALSGYTFPLFQKMNELGHFTILFDGLDEMRYAMTWDDFQYNFRQISKIILKETKAILFGRPNTFRSKQEYEQIIEGIRYVGDQSLLPAGALQFETVDIETFSKEEIYVFLRRFLQWKVGIIKHSLLDIEKRISEIEELGLDELFARPVHAQMIAEIASDFSAPLAKFSRYQLYDTFIQMVMARDFERSSGSGIAPHERRQFMRQLSWQLWFILNATSFRLGQITFPSIVSARAQDGVEREYLSGALLESKYGDFFYFSHRSFQEFLIAEGMVLGDNDLINSVDIEKITDEIVEFLGEAEDIGRLELLFNKICESTTSFWPRTFDTAYSIYKRLLYRNRLADGQGATSIQLFCFAKRIFEQRGNDLRIADKLNELIDVVITRMRRRPVYFYLAIQFLFDVQSVGKTAEWRHYAYRRMMYLTLAIAPLEKFYHQVEGTSGSVISVRRKDGIGAALLKEAMEIARDPTTREIVIRLHPIRFYNVLERFPSSIVWHAKMWELPDEVVQIAIAELGPQSDEILKLTRQILASMGDAEKVRFVEAVGDDSSGEFIGNPESWFDPPTPSA